MTDYSDAEIGGLGSGPRYPIDPAKRYDADDDLATGQGGVVTEHRWLGLVWKPDGVTPTHRVRCACGWISTTPEVGYGYPTSHEDDYEQHVKEAS